MLRSAVVVVVSVFLMPSKPTIMRMAASAAPRIHKLELERVL